MSKDWITDLNQMVACACVSIIIEFHEQFFLSLFNRL